MSRRTRYGFDEPSVILSGGPSHSRAAEDDDPPYVPPTLPLGFTARSTSGDLGRDEQIFSTFAPSSEDPMPLLWDGDQA